MTASRSSLKHKWRVFLTAIFDPRFLSLFVVTVFLAVALTQQQNQLVVTALTILVSVMSALVGKLYEENWSSLTEETLTAARGKVAVRSLKLLFSKLVGLEHRVLFYLWRHAQTLESDNLSPEIIKTYLEEVVERCKLLQEDALSSIQNWTDIVPEADLRPQIDKITDLRYTAAAKMQQIDALNKNLEEAHKHPEEENTRLRQEKTQLEKELADTKLELRKTTSSFGSLLSASSLTASPFADQDILSLANESIRFSSSSGLTGGACLRCGRFSFSLDGDRLCEVCASSSQSDDD